MALGFDFRSRRIDEFLAARRNNDIRAGVRQSQSQRAAQSTGAAEYDRSFVSEAKRREFHGERETFRAAKREASLL